MNCHDEFSISMSHYLIDVHIFNCRFSHSFYNISHTLYMCPIQHKNKLVNEYPHALFYIDVFTSSEEPLWYSLMIEPVKDFVLE